MIDPLRALALSCEENGDHALAITVLEKARYVTRVHQGLSSADEALPLRQEIRDEKARSNHPRVRELEQDTVTIARQNHDGGIVALYRRCIRRHQVRPRREY